MRAPHKLPGQSANASVESEVLAFFQGKGLSRAQAAGIWGNIKQESSGNPKEAGGGLDQGQGARDHSALDTSGQLAAIWAELAGPYKGTLAELQKTKTPQEAARVFSGSAASGKGFERPGDPQLANREKYAAEAYGSSTTVGEQITNVVEAPINAVKSVGEALGEVGSDIGTVVSVLTSPETWLRVAEGIGGMILLAVGLKTLTKGSPAAQAAQPVHHVVRKAAETAAVIAA